ncbi:MAG: Na(+)/H(+) antiporter subunit C [Acidimicrobiia bacterium]
MNLALIAVAAVLFGMGTYLLLQRALTRIVIGLALVANGANVLLLVAGGPAGDPPIVTGAGGTVSDPLPQAMALTAIVITFGVTAFLLALALRGHALTGSDQVEDDLEDRRIARRAGR